MLIFCKIIIKFKKTATRFQFFNTYIVNSNIITERNSETTRDLYRSLGLQIDEICLSNF